MTSAGLDEISGGRFVLGLGASGPQVIEGFHGVPYDAPLQRTREIVEICRTVWKREEPLVHDGKKYQSRCPRGRAPGSASRSRSSRTRRRSDIPIHVASLGPKNVALTAEIADGWLPIFFHPEKADDVWGADLEAGTAKRVRRPRRRSTSSPVVSLAIGPEDEVRVFRDFTRSMIALYVGGMGAREKNFYNDLVQRYGYEAEAKEIQDLYLDGKKDEAAAAVPDGAARGHLARAATRAS